MVRPIALDVSDAAAIESITDQVASARGSIDILVNCVGVDGMQFLLDISEAEFDRIISINLKGPLFVTQAVARRMIERSTGGAIINIASAAGRRASPGSMVYSASKAGVISVTQGAALELAKYKIRVNALAPGAVETSMWDSVKSAYGAVEAEGVSLEALQLAATPLGRLCKPRDCADAILFLCSEQSGFITGQTFNVDGGMYLN